MKELFSLTSTIGEIIMKLPLASQIFNQYKIDYCSNGNRNLGDVLKEKQLNEHEILATLNELYQNSAPSNEKNWEEAPLQDLVVHIINNYHKNTTELLNEINGYVTQIYQVDGQEQPYLREVYKLFSYLKIEMEHHMIDEERDVFPHIVAYSKTASLEQLTMAKEELERLEIEHVAASNILAKLRDVTNDYELPQDACNTYLLTYLRLRELELLTFEHIHLENNILFKRLMSE